MACLQSGQSNNFVKVTKRREDLENLCLCIDFNSTRLLDGTVTELLLSREQDTNRQKLCLKTRLDPESEYAQYNLWLRIQEDEFRVRFPVYNTNSNCVPTRDLSAIKKIEELGMCVHLVHVGFDQCVYKEIDRPLYIPKDSEVLEVELRNLVQLYGNDGIVRLIAVVVSDNRYRTKPAIKSDISTSLQGIFLEYHPPGMLQKALQLPEPNYTWHLWAPQVTSALKALHRNGITHMDLKPENIVLSKDRHAILIDLSGIGGMTRKWLSPEMRPILDPSSEDIGARKQNDIWALGKILSAMAHATRDPTEHKVLNKVSLLATKEAPRVFYFEMQFLFFYHYSLRRRVFLKRQH